MMRTWFHPRTGEGAALLGVLTFLLLEVIVLSALPLRDRLVTGGVFAGAAVAAFVLVAVLLRGHRAARPGTDRPSPSPSEGDWFSPDTLEGFPTEAVRPLLHGPDAPSPDTLSTAWILATHGRDAAWIAHHVDLPVGTAHLLVDAARRREAGAVHAQDPPGRG
ncbi:hypothetical protein P3T27_004895 [Kitasatospora sp. MAA19]|uniref:hypothetical protein n=1 Tax=unclassified Kitasatospora TaxID=2633591 RepID=UPI0024742CFF|nr:hypothetical protein [Kitasatospora sp. MAA19]MDH6708156.1 hypothetical protein [Kitasatospora sp. MAA19]